MKHFCLFLLMIMWSIHSMQEESSHIKKKDTTYFSFLPREIKDQIASFLWFSDDIGYEHDTAFLAKVSQSSSQPLKRAQIDENVFMHINDRLSLELIDSNSCVLQKVINSNLDNSDAFNEALAKQDAIYQDFYPANRVDFFAISPDRKKIVALVQNERLEMYSLESEKTEKMGSFDMNIYYQNDGRVIDWAVPAQYKILLRLENAARGYCAKKIYDKFTNRVYWDHFAEKWYNQPKALAISNKGDVVFANDHQIFKISKDRSTYIKIYESGIKDVGPYAGASSLIFLPFTQGNILNMHFNQQSTKLGLILNGYVDVFHDKNTKNLYNKKQNYTFLTIEQYEQELKANQVQEDIKNSIIGKLKDKDQSIKMLKKEEIILFTDHEEKPTWEKYCFLKGHENI